MSNIPLFYCRGAFDFDNMSLKDRVLCNLLKKVVSKKDPSKYKIWEKALMEAFDSKNDWTDEKYIKPIIDYINQSINNNFYKIIINSAERGA